MLFRSALLSAAVWLVFLVGMRASVVAPEDCGNTDPAAMEAAARNAVTWIIKNQHGDGTYLYEYNAETGQESTFYNSVRHAGATWSLYQAYGRFGDSDMLAAADKGMAWMLERVERRHGWVALAATGSTAELGASDLMLVALEERRLATGDGQYDDLMRGLATFIVSLQRDDGGFYIGYDLATDRPLTEGTSKYYPGESLLGLALLHKAFPAEGWDAPARKALEFITTKRDDVEDVDFPPLADQWAAYSIGEMADWGLTDQQIDYARSLAGRFGLLVRTEAQRQGSWYGHLTHGEYGRGAGAGTWIEGLTGLWRASQKDQRLADLAGPLKERAVCVSGIMIARQASAKDAQAYADPVKVEGAWFRDGMTRMDDQQHTMSGLIYTLDAIAGDAERAP